jgi:hypothetical protein
MEVAPIRIEGIDQVKLPVAFPFLQSGFAVNGRRHGRMVLIPNQQSQSICPTETFERAILVIGDTCPKGARHSNVKRSIALVCDDVDSGGFSSCMAKSSCLLGGTLQATILTYQQIVLPLNCFRPLLSRQTPKKSSWPALRGPPTFAAKISKTLAATDLVTCIKCEAHHIGWVARVKRAITTFLCLRSSDRREDDTLKKPLKSRSGTLSNTRPGPSGSQT